MLRIFAIVAFLVAAPAAADEIAGAARIVDGDTLVIGRERVRLQNFNAPEMDRPGGPEARDALATLVGERAVACLGHARDRYGRLVARCTVEGIDLGERLKAAGLRQERRR